MIESLKCKTEESEDPAAELSEEETDAIKENLDPTSPTKDATAERFEKNDMKESANGEPRQTRKQMKVAKDGEKNKTPTEKPGGPDTDTETKQVQSGVPENGIKNLSRVQIPARGKPKGTSKRMKVDKDDEPTSATDDTAADMYLKNDMEALQNIPANGNPKKTSKQMKVDKDGETKETLTEKPDGPDADTETKQVQSGVPEWQKKLASEGQCLSERVVWSTDKKHRNSSTNK